MKNERNIPDPAPWEDWEEIVLSSTNEHGNGDESLRVDLAGNYHVIAAVAILNGKRIVVTDLSFQEAAKWCAHNLVPEPFDDYLLARV